jgi:hemerythrin-like domain-containing protein
MVVSLLRSDSYSLFLSSIYYIFNLGGDVTNLVVEDRTLSSGFNSISDMVSFFHRDMDEYILLHQEALLVQDIELAKSVFALFRNMLESHIDIENRILFPLFESHLEINGLSAACNALPTDCDNDNTSNQPRWPLFLYQKEHDKLLMMMDKAERMVNSLHAMSDSSQQRRAILQVLEYQRSFKNVIEHHEEREEIAFLPELDKALSDMVIKETIDCCLLEWIPVQESLSRQLADSRKALP